MIEIGGVTSWYQSRLPVGNPLTTPWSKLSLVFAKNYFANLLFGLRANIDVTTCDIYGIRILFSLPMTLVFYLLILAGKVC